MVGLAVWVVALTAAFQTGSSYSSTTGTGGTAALWFLAGALGAVTAFASSALAPRRARTAVLLVAAAVTAACWLAFAAVRFIDGHAVLPL